MLDILFFSAIAFYFVTMIVQFCSVAFKKDAVRKTAWVLSLLSFAVATAYLVARGIEAGRLPLSNQFEFAAAFGWGIGLFCVILYLRIKQGWILTVGLPAAFIALSYAALLPREIGELMPALRSAWFGLHIGSAVFSYSAFAMAGAVGVKYLCDERKKADTEEMTAHLAQLDHLSYRLVAVGFLTLTVVILSGCVWAEQAWSTFWSWDPKETWALITWIIYAIYLHQRMRKNWRGKRMAWFAILAVIAVIFTFVGVNTLMSGLHSYQ
jgi:cytochrome c-type biogenesis protein CcsB